MSQVNTSTVGLGNFSLLPIDFTNSVNSLNNLAFLAVLYLKILFTRCTSSKTGCKNNKNAKLFLSEYIS